MRNVDRRWTTAGLAGFACLTTLLLTAAAGTFTGEETRRSEEEETRAKFKYESESVEGTPLHTALRDLPDDVRAYNDHLTFLADPFCAGRLPGTQGMEVAKQYVQYYFEQTGLEPGFHLDLSENDTKAAETSADAAQEKFAAWRQPFPLGSSTEIIVEQMAYQANSTKRSLKAGEDFKVLTYGGSGEVEAPITFVGYSIVEGDDGYTNYDDETDLTGRIAMMFRFEPMNEDGGSQWSERRWTRRAGFHNKISNAVERGAAGVVVVNPPGTNDERAESVNTGGGGRSRFDVPVALMSIEAGEAFMQAADPDGRSLMELRRYADEGGPAFEFDNAKINLNVEIESEAQMAENVGGLLRGRGALADEFIVIGAHLDHLGDGQFGSRAGADGAGKLHPGADDNASGSAGILVIADKLARAYRELPEETDLRSILFIAFSGEESGLNGSRYYVRNPVVPLEQHALMMNFDMIGRIKDRRLSVSGATTATGMEEFLDPIFEASELEVVRGSGTGGGSDHAAFYRAEVPVLFAIIADFHGDYHTPEDQSWKINRADAVRACNLWTEIALACAQRPEFFKFADPDADDDEGDEADEDEEARPARPEIKVRFGIVPDYNASGGGVHIDDVTADSSADLAGVRPGDRLIKWNDQEIEDMGAWMRMLAEHEPGDEVRITVEREETKVVLKVTLQGR